MSTNSLTWVDDQGIATLSNLKGEGGNRFGGWTPDRVPIGPAVTGLGTGRLFRFEFRRDDLISFEIAAIPGSELDLMLRCKYHLMKGGVVTVTTDRPLAANFASCAMAPDTVPSIDFSDRETLEYTFSVILRASTATDLDIITPVLPSLVWWGRAALLMGVVADGATSDTLPDASVNNYDGVQSDAAKRMTFRENAEGGYPALEADFANADHYLTPLTINPSLGSTLILVLRRWGTPVEHGNYFGFTDATGENASLTRILSRSESGGGDGVLLRWNSPTSTLGTGVDTRFLIGLKIASVTSITPYFNSLTAGTVFNPDNDINKVSRLCIGRDNAIAGNTGNNQFFEGLLYDDELNTADFNRSMRYMAAANGITLV